MEVGGSGRSLFSLRNDYASRSLSMPRSQNIYQPGVRGEADGWHLACGKLILVRRLKKIV